MYCIIYKIKCDLRIIDFLKEKPTNDINLIKNYIANDTQYILLETNYLNF